jgi:hypothetical protein
MIPLRTQLELNALIDRRDEESIDHILHAYNSNGKAVNAFQKQAARERQAKAER